MSTINVVIIDDDEVVRQGLKQSIPWKNLGFSLVGEANNGKSGLDLIEAVKPQLVILDIKMQGMDGLEVCRAIRERGIKSNIILLSGYSDFEYARTAIKEGVLEYILKPVYRPDFIKILKSVRKKILGENEKKTQEMITKYKAKVGETAAVDELIMKVIINEDVKEAMDKLKLIGLELKLDKPTIALIELDIPDEEYKLKYRKYIQKIIKSSGLVFQIKGNKLGVLFPWASKFIIERISQETTKAFNFDITIGVGKVSESIETIRNSYSQAYLALKQKFYQGSGMTFYFNEKMNYTRDYIYLMKYEDAIFNHMINFSNNEIGTVIDLFFGSFNENDLLEPKVVLGSAIRLLANLESKVMKNKGMESFAVQKDKSFVEVTLSMDTLAGLKSYVESYIKNMTDYIQANDVTAEKRIVSTAISYMEKEYRIATLSTVAEHVFISPNYLSFLFKVETGSTFIDKLSEIRIAKAKELLSSLRYKTYEVAELVGYNDARYFSQVFKKYTGCLPSNFQTK